MENASTIKKKSLILKENAKGTSLYVIVEMLGRHVDTIRQYLRHPLPMNKRSDCDTSETVPARDLRYFIQKLREKFG